MCADARCTPFVIFCCRAGKLAASSSAARAQRVATAVALTDCEVCMRHDSRGGVSVVQYVACRRRIRMWCRFCGLVVCGIDSCSADWLDFC